MTVSFDPDRVLLWVDQYYVPAKWQIPAGLAISSAAVYGLWSGWSEAQDWEFLSYLLAIVGLTPAIARVRGRRSLAVTPEGAYLLHNDEVRSFSSHEGKVQIATGLGMTRILFDNFEFTINPSLEGHDMLLDHYAARTWPGVDTVGNDEPDDYAPRGHRPGREVIRVSERVVEGLMNSIYLPHRCTKCSAPPTRATPIAAPWRPPDFLAAHTDRVLEIPVCESCHRKHIAMRLGLYLSSFAIAVLGLKFSGAVWSGSLVLGAFVPALLWRFGFADRLTRWWCFGARILEQRDRTFVRMEFVDPELARYVVESP